MNEWMNLILNHYFNKWDSELWNVENQLHTTSIRQSTYQDLGQKFGLRRILFISLTCGAFCTIKKSFLRLILSVQILYLIMWCIWIQVFCSVYQFTCSKNDSNSNIQWSQRHNLYKTVMKKVSNHKPFVTPNLSRYKSQHHFNSTTVYKKQHTCAVSL